MLTKLSTRPILVLGLLALLVSLAYGNALRNGFVYDDNFVILRNGLITRLDMLPKLVTSDYWITRYDPYGERPLPKSSGLYRPLVFLTYALNYAIAGLEPAGYHLVNILLHVAVTWLLYLLAIQIRITPGGAILAAALFAVHPIHTEAVTNVVGRAELLMSVGVLASLFFAVTGRRWLSMVTFGLSLFSKEQAIIFPALLLLYDLCFQPPIANVVAPRGSLSLTGFHNPVLILRFVLIRYGPYVPVLFVYLLARWAALGGFALPPTPMIDNPLGAIEGVERLYSVLKVDGLYLKLFFWPAALSVDYSYDAIPAAHTLFEPAVLFGLMGWAGLVVGMGWAYLYRDRRIAFSLGFTILAFFPVSNLVVLIGTIMGERLFYLPSAGLCLIAGIAYERVTSNAGRPHFFYFFPRALQSLAVHMILVVVCLALTARTIVRNLDWLNDETAFRSALRVVPGSAKVNSTLGILSLPGRKWEIADASFKTALRIYPTYSLTDPDMMAKMGAALLGKGEVEEATDLLERAVALEHDNRFAQYNLGLAYAQGGRYEDADRYYRRALALDQKDADTYNSLSYALTKLQRYEEAEKMAREAIKIRPAFMEAHYNLGRALESQGHIDEAISEYQQVVKIDPNAERVRERMRRLQAKR